MLALALAVRVQLAQILDLQVCLEVAAHHLALLLHIYPATACGNTMRHAYSKLNRTELQ
jgi:hypothetical protein